MSETLHFTLYNIPSLHNRNQAALIEEVRSKNLRLGRRQYRATITIHHEWLKTNGDVNTRNSDNIEKSINDAIQKATGVNDAYFEGWETVRRKVHTTGMPFAEITLEPI